VPDYGADLRQPNPSLVALTQGLGIGNNRNDTKRKSVDASGTV
jgi:hypothetical protein